MNKLPIFIHSLFRAGSTYLFMVFRRSSGGYWCYQEPLHELAFFSRDDVKFLQVDHGASKTALLRHPHIEEDYFRELRDVWPAWQEKITERSIYANYFAPPEVDIGIPYWQSLIEASKGRPVFQECRTSGRIGAIKAALGGGHIYLWRNPWDQWWSYKVAPYFDTVNQLIVRAPNAPAPVVQLRTALGMEDEAPSGLAAAFEYYGARPQGSEKSYLVFYMLWCLGLREGMTHADVMLSIDRLSDSPVYRDEMQGALLAAGISGIDFSDCHVPQGRYLEQDRLFFEPLEERVHKWLLEGGWAHEELQLVQATRRQFEPFGWGIPVASCAPADSVEQASRARALARRHETHLAETVSALIGKIGALETEAMQAEAKAQQAEARPDQAAAESRAQVVEVQAELAAIRQELNDVQRSNHHYWTQLETTRQELHQVHQSNHHHCLLSEQRAKEIEALRASLSWAITAPLRWLAAPVRRRGDPAAVPSAPSLVDRAVRWGMGQPQLVTFAHRCLQRYPKVREAITRRVAMAMHAPSVTQQAPAATQSGDLGRLTPRARQIYADLKSAIEQREGKR